MQQFKLLLPLILSALFQPVIPQVTEVAKNTEIFEKPDGKTIGDLVPGASITKLSKDKTGRFIKATTEFYIPVEALRESRIARGVGETQTTGQAAIRLLRAEKNAKTITISVEIENRGKSNLDMSALMLLTLMDRDGNPGNLEIMRSKNSVGIIKPGATLVSELIYTFPRDPKDVELAFQSKLGSEQVYFMLGF